MSSRPSSDLTEEERRLIGEYSSKLKSKAGGRERKDATSSRESRRVLRSSVATERSLPRSRSRSSTRIGGDMEDSERTPSQNTTTRTTTSKFVDYSTAETEEGEGDTDLQYTDGGAGVDDDIGEYGSAASVSPTLSSSQQDRSRIDHFTEQQAHDIIESNKRNSSFRTRRLKEITLSERDRDKNETPEASDIEEDQGGQSFLEQQERKAWRNRKQDQQKKRRVRRRLFDDKETEQMFADSLKGTSAVSEQIYSNNMMEQELRGMARQLRKMENKYSIETILRDTLGKDMDLFNALHEFSAQVCGSVGRKMSDFWIGETMGKSALVEHTMKMLQKHYSNSPHASFAQSRPIPVPPQNIPFREVDLRSYLRSRLREALPAKKVSLTEELLSNVYRLVNSGSEEFRLRLTTAAMASLERDARVKADVILANEPAVVEMVAAEISSLVMQHSEMIALQSAKEKGIDINPIHLTEMLLRISKDQNAVGLWGFLAGSSSSSFYNAATHSATSDSTEHINTILSHLVNPQFWAPIRKAHAILKNTPSLHDILVSDVIVAPFTALVVAEYNLQHLSQSQYSSAIRITHARAAVGSAIDNLLRATGRLTVTFGNSNFIYNTSDNKSGFDTPKKKMSFFDPGRIDI